MHSNNTTVQNPKNRPSQPKRLRSRRKGPKPEKEGFFHSPIFRITCIIRNIIKNQKQRPPSPAFRHRCRFGSLCCSLYHFVWDVWIACQAGIVKYSWTRPLSCERPLHQTLQRRIQRLCSEVRADRFIVSARATVLQPSSLPNCATSSSLVTKHCSARTAGQFTSSNKVKLRSSLTSVWVLSTSCFTSP